MELECCRAGAAIREDYRVLANCEVEIQIPKVYPKVLLFYQKMAAAAVRWSEERLFEMVKKEYLALPDLWAKSAFLPYRFRLHGDVVFENAACFALVCESTLLHGNERRLRRAAQVWDKREESILPLRQILRSFGGRKIPKQKEFRATGGYPENGNLILFRNADSTSPFAERKIQLF